ncbi:MAG: NADH-quinone oxidoreductase subunit L, partial [Candidatus Lindowbacteria bacterium]|nr:NADH-quinone oxidoreductase subunit L [Candidatus Lindowbacteria bacterium]
IHAATMVVAGIFLVARTSPIFPEEGMLLTAWVGAFTALFAASMALVQPDFKKILAYSSISQLGFMLSAIGVGALTAGMYHLFTHAFFKALLFLGSGSVLHAVHTRQMSEMGGLAKKMPWTCATMYVGAFALAGFPFLFSGFYSKDAILGGALLFAFEGQHNVHGVLGTIKGLLGYGPFILLISAAALTAFYTFRMMILVFHGEPKNKEKYDHAHEMPATMTVPLIILAVLSTVLFPLMFGNTIEHLVNPHGHGHHGADAERAHHIAMIMSIVFALGGIALAYLMYYFNKIPTDIFMRTPQGKAAHRVFLNLYWMDEFYAVFIKKVVVWAEKCASFDRRVIDGAVDSAAPGLVFSSKGSGATDKYIVDYIVNLVGDVTRVIGNGVRQLQTGKIQDYALGAMTAILLFAFWISF